MSFMVFLLLLEVGEDRIVWATLGKGRRALGREKEFFFPSLELTSVCWDTSAKGDETKGRGGLFNEAAKGKR